MPVERIDAAAGQGLGLSVDELVADAVAGGAMDPVKRRGGGDYVLAFRTKKDGRVRPEHAALEGRIWELDDHDAPVPPLAPNCRCEVRIEPRETASDDQTKTPAASLRQFDDLADNLATVYPQDVVDAYGAGKLKPDDIIIKRTGDRITTAQARAIIASREAGASTTAALKAVAELADFGLSGRTLALIVDAARVRLAKGGSAMAAAKGAISATARRGYVTARTVDAAARALARSRLLDGA